MPRQLDLAFFGMPLAALLLAADGHRIVYAAIARDEAPGKRRLRAMLGPRAYVKPDLTSPAAIDRVAASRPDLLVSWFWTKRLPRDLLGLAPGVGVHPSLLPKHRGPDPYFWAIDCGDDVTGVTAHALEEGYDTGGILAQVPLRIDPSWNAWTLARELDRPSLRVLREVVGAYARGTPPRPKPQDEARATYEPAPTEDMLEIRWTEPTERIARRVRAAAPWPGAFTEIGGETVVITSVRPTADFPRALEPGEGAVRRGVAVVRTADGALELLAGRTEEDETDLDAAALADRLAGRIS